MPDGAPDWPVLDADGPVLVFGGCASNLQATGALFAEARRLGVPPARMVCTGDIVAYGADPEPTFDLVARSGIAVVMGNCEEQLAAGAQDCGCGFTPGSLCDHLSAAWFAHADARLGPAARAWMAALPRRIDLVLGGRRLAAVHGAPGRINRYRFASDGAAALADEVARAGTDGVIGGHCGLPFTRGGAGWLWHNAGAIGLPANDGTPRGWFSLLIPERGGIRIRHLPLAYDHAGAARAMRRAGLPEPYADALECGLWPSVDILPSAEMAQTAVPLAPGEILWAGAAAPSWPEPLPATVEPPAEVALAGLRTLWCNTGTLCNIACAGCYIESGPRNDRLAYLSFAEFARFLAEARQNHPELAEIGFTGGEPFLNHDLPAMLAAALDAGLRVLVLTNAMRPMQRHARLLGALRAAHGDRLGLRVSLDHFTRAGHEAIRGPGSWAPALTGLRWLAAEGFALRVAARLPDPAEEAAVRAGFAGLFAELGLALDATDPDALVLFPEINGAGAVPPVGARLMAALAPRRPAPMCASSRMVLRRRGAAAAEVIACTLLPYAEGFALGATLAEAARPVALAHETCARFCVLGGASCAGRAV